MCRLRPIVKAIEGQRLMNTGIGMEVLAATLWDVMKWGAIIIGVAVALGVVGMLLNGVLTGRRVKEGDEAKTDLVEEALQVAEKEGEKPVEKVPPEEEESESFEEE